MKKADSTDPAKYLPILARHHVSGVTGNIAFDENGDIKGGSISLYQAKGGEVGISRYGRRLSGQRSRETTPAEQR
jgi:branched-chain amino acid transport system substrate-binding protein